MDATRQSWKNLKPLPSKRSSISLERTFSQQEFGRLCRGYIPERMEDKWFIFREGDVIFFHRSWTGSCIFELHLAQEGSRYAVGHLYANRDESQYRGATDAYDVRLVTYLIDTLLLNQRSPLPIPETVPAGIAQDLHLEHMVGAGQFHSEQKPIVITLGGTARWFWRWLVWLFKR